MKPSRSLQLLMIVVLVAAACTTGAEATSTTATPTFLPETTTTTPSAVSTTTPATPETTTTSTTAVKTPSTEAWDTWTLILASIETGGLGAEEQAHEVADRVEGAAVLYSDDYPSLNPGYWVVYWGSFESGSAAGAWCGDEPDDLTCYPRYLGPDVSPLAGDGNAMLIDGEALVIVDVSTGDRRKLFDAYFSGDGMWVGRMALTPDATTLYYDVGWEDSWYSCEASRGQVWNLSLAFGTKTVVASGYAPAVSPDGRWLAVLESEQCLPDPAEPDIWVLTPTDTVVLYDLATGRPVEVRRWTVGEAPVSYEDPNMVTWVDWRIDSESLLVMNNAGTVFEVALDSAGPLDTGSRLVEGINGFPQALVGQTLYIVRDETPEEWGGFDIVAVDLTTGDEGEVITQTVGWPYVAADTTRTRLIWGSDTRVGTAETMFGLENYLGGFAW